MGSASSTRTRLAAFLRALPGPGVLGVLVLAWVALAVVGGRFNDGGWYLSCARLLTEGAVPYRDFPFAHPPLALLAHLPAALLPGVAAVAAGRLAAFGMSLLGLALAAAALPAALRRRAAGLAVLLLAIDPFAVQVLTLVKSYPPTLLALGATLLALARGAPGLAGAALGLGVGVRLSLLAALPGLVLAFGPRDRRSLRALAAFAVTSLAIWGPTLVLSDGAVLSQLYLPFAVADPVNPMTGLYLEAEVGATATEWLARLRTSLLRTAWTHPLALLLAVLGLRGVRSGDPATRFAGAGGVGMALAHLLARRPYDEYHLVLAPCVLVLATRALAATPADVPPARRWVALLGLALAALPSSLRFRNRIDLRPAPALVELRQAADHIRAVSAPGDALLTLDAYLVVGADRRPYPGLELGRFGLRGARADADLGAGGIALPDLLEALRAGRAPVVALPARGSESLDPVDAFADAAARSYRLVATLRGFGETGQDLEILVRRLPSEGEAPHPEDP